MCDLPFSNTNLAGLDTLGSKSPSKNHPPKLLWQSVAVRDNRNLVVHNGNVSVQHPSKWKLGGRAFSESQIFLDLFFARCLRIEGKHKRYGGERAANLFGFLEFESQLLVLSSGVCNNIGEKSVGEFVGGVGEDGVYRLRDLERAVAAVSGLEVLDEGVVMADVEQ